MTMAIFAVYDTTGIQDYVFASGKLSECRGASKLVRSVFSKMLPDSLPDGSIKDWDKRLNDPLDINAPAEIISTGGGNAYVVYHNKEVFQNSTKRFLRTVLKKTSGIGVTVAAVETNLKDGFVEDYKFLQKRISETKGNINTMQIAGSQSITRTSSLTGEPVTRIEQSHGEWQSISEGQHYKRIAAASVDSESIGFDNSAETDNSKKSIEFDDLKETDNNYLGVIHADGNDMSDRIREYAASESDWYNAVPLLRRMSHDITLCFQKAFDLTKAEYKEYFTKAGKTMPPIIPLVTDGEDMTFFAPGQYAISLAAKYLRHVEALDIYPFRSDSSNKLTACAGVTLFHSHFPVSKAYAMAEELCSIAKGEARRARDRGDDLSFLDFHIHASGFVTGITDFRNSYYPVLLDGKIYTRPLCTTPDVEDKDRYNEYDQLEHFITLIQHSDEHPRSKLKDIRAALQQLRNDGMSEVDMLVADLKLTEKLPKYSGVFGKYAALNDALEIMDIFAEISEGV